MIRINVRIYYIMYKYIYRVWILYFHRKPGVDQGYFFGNKYKLSKTISVVFMRNQKCGMIGAPNTENKIVYLL